MTIEVTDADVEAVEAIIAKSDSDRASNSWECVDPKEIIAAALEVMAKKQQVIKKAEDKQERLQSNESYADWCKNNGQFPGG